MGLPMKALKTFFIFVLPLVVFVACEKSDIKPRVCGDDTPVTQPADEAPVNGRMKASDNGLSDPGTGDIVGGGDDDRDGGDKKKAGK